MNASIFVASNSSTTTTTGKDDSASSATSTSTASTSAADISTANTTTTTVTTSAMLGFAVFREGFIREGPQCGTCSWRGGVHAPECCFHENNCKK